MTEEEQILEINQIVTMKIIEIEAEVDTMIEIVEIKIIIIEIIEIHQINSIIMKKVIKEKIIMKLILIDIIIEANITDIIQIIKDIELTKIYITKII